MSEDNPTLSSAIRGGMMATIPDGMDEVWPADHAEAVDTVELEEDSNGDQSKTIHDLDMVLMADDTFQNEEADVMDISDVEVCDADDDTNLCFISNKRRRQKSFSKRKRTLLKLAKNLHIMTGAKVQLTITAESGNISKYNSHVVERRSVKTQKGSPLKSPRMVTREQSHNHTPTKRRKVSTNQDHQSPPVVGLPGTKRQAMTTRALTSPVQNKCKVCKTIFGSKQDKALTEKHGRQATWIGCENEKCNYWTHALCAGIFIRPRQKIHTIPFHCPVHKV